MYLGFYTREQISVPHSDALICSQDMSERSSAYPLV